MPSGMTERNRWGAVGQYFMRFDSGEQKNMGLQGQGYAYVFINGTGLRGVTDYVM